MEDLQNLLREQDKISEELEAMNKEQLKQLEEQQASLDNYYKKMDEIFNSDEVRNSIVSSVREAERICNEEQDNDRKTILDYRKWISSENPPLENRYSFWINYITNKLSYGEDNESKKIDIAIRGLKYSSIIDLINKSETMVGFYDEFVEYLDLKKEEIEKQKLEIQKKTLEESVTKKFNHYMDAFILYSDGKLYTQEQQIVIDANNEKLDKLNIRLKKDEKKKRVPIIGSLSARRINETEQEIKKLKSVSKDYADANLIGFASRLKNELNSYARVSSALEFEALMLTFLNTLVNKIMSYRSQLKGVSNTDNQDIMIDVLVNTQGFDGKKYMLDSKKVGLYTEIDFDNPENIFTDYEKNKKLIIYNNNLIQALSFMCKEYYSHLEKFEKSELNSMLNDTDSNEVSDDKDKKSSY